MRLIIRKTHYLQGDITLPGSKSQAVRALFFALLASGESHIQNLPEGEDIQTALTVIQALGAEIVQEGSAIRVRGCGVPLHHNSGQIHTGNSGLTTRFALPLLGLRHNPEQTLLLSCGQQMQQRPMDSLIKAVNDLGLCVPDQVYPLRLTGKLLGGKTKVSGITSQFISALLMALPLAPQDSEVIVEDLHERPYLDMTEEWLKRLGVQINHERKTDQDHFIIPAQQSYPSFDYRVPADFSSASYGIAAGVLFPGKIQISGLDFQDKQGDKQFIDILIQMGADIQISSTGLSIQGGKPLKGISIDANAIPDLLPTLAVIGTYAQGQTEIHHVPQARLKETDRIASMAQNLSLMGAKIIEKPDGLIVEQSTLRGARVKSFGDHRTAMALTLAGMMASDQTVLEEAEAIHKTYPSFVDCLLSLGASLEISHG